VPIAATLGTEEAQLAVCVTSWVLLSVYVPTASNCRLSPSGIAALLGVMAIDTRLGPVTVNVLLAEIAFDVPVMVVVPCPALVANP
jgi:poly-beta-hydroxyalkanoate depolymerase